MHGNFRQGCRARVICAGGRAKIIVMGDILFEYYMGLVSWPFNIKVQDDEPIQPMSKESYSSDIQNFFNPSWNYLFTLNSS